MKNLILIVALVMPKTVCYSQVKLFCDKEQSTISYYMHHPLHEWTGVNKDVTSIILTDENRKVITKVAVAVKIASFDSKNANRDSHVIETTEAIKYPGITFTSDSISQDGEKLEVTGVLTFHGVSKIISFEADIKNIKDKVEVSGNFILKMTQFKIEPPSLLGMATDDDFKISFDMFY